MIPNINIFFIKNIFTTSSNLFSVTDGDNLGLYIGVPLACVAVIVGGGVAGHRYYKRKQCERFERAPGCDKTEAVTLQNTDSKKEYV